MESLFAILGSGLLGASREIDVWGGDVANAATPGFQALIPETVALPNVAVGTNLQVPGGVRVTTEQSLEEGPLLPAEGGVALPAGEYLAVTEGGQTYYTRDGAMAVDSQGRLTVAGGLLLGTNGQPIALPAGTSPEVGSDGWVYARTSGGARLRVGQLAVVTFANPEGLQAVGGNLMSATAASGPPVPVAQPNLTGGFVVGSNVDLASALPLLLLAERRFQAEAQVATVGETMQQRLDQLVG